MKIKLRSTMITLGLAGIMTFALLLLQLGVAEAAGTPTYGATQTPSNPVSGYNQVVNEVAINVSGQNTTLTGQITTVSGSTISINITLPGGDFSGATDTYELILSECGSPTADVTGISGYTAYACFGVEIMDTTTDTAYETMLNSPITLTASGSSILASPANILSEFNSTTNTWGTITGNIIGGIDINIASDPDFALLAQSTSSTTGTVAGATTATTGKPFVGEEIGAGVILFAGLLGVGLLIRTKRRK